MVSNILIEKDHPMHTDLKHLSTIWRDERTNLIDRLTDDILAHAGPSYELIPREQMLIASAQVIDAWQTALDNDDRTPVCTFARGMGRRRAEAHVGIDEIMTVIDLIRDMVWYTLRQLYANGGWDHDMVAKIEDWLHAMRNSTVGSYGETLRAAEKELADREQALAMQHQLIQELSTPIVPLHDGVLVLPLVGAVDTRRATQIVEAVLEQIVTHQADVCIVDITGVAVVDTSVANHILHLTQAVRLLGATIVLVGISPEIAQTLVQLGVDLGNISIRANLQAGIADALQRCGLMIQPIQQH